MMRRRWIYWVIALLNLAALAVYVAVFISEDIVPVHYGIQGTADRWGSKWELSWLGILPPLLLAGYELYRKKVKNPRNLANRKYEDIYVPLIAMMFIPLSWLMVLFRSETMAGAEWGWLSVLLGAMMVVLSNIMGKISPNRNFGLRIPWTLKDDEVWRATHRRAAYWGVAGGLVMILGGLLALKLGYAWSIGSVIGGIVVMVAPPTVFAYRMYRRLHPNG